MGTRSGYALLPVLWLLVTLAVLATAATATARAALAGAANRIGSTRAAWRAEGCAAWALATLDSALVGRHDRSSDPARGWRALDAVLANQRWPSGCVVRVEPAGMRLDVNAVSHDELLRFFHVCGVNPARADSLAAALLDWRDADDEARPAGAEATWYRAAQRVPPRNAVFADAREIALVRGFDGWAGLDSLLGVDHAKTALWHAPFPVLATLPGFGDELLARVSELRRWNREPAELADLAGALSPRAREAFLRSYPELVRRATLSPDSWVMTVSAGDSLAPVHAHVELRLRRAGGRAAVVARRSWQW